MHMYIFRNSVRDPWCLKAVGRVLNATRSFIPQLYSLFVNYKQNMEGSRPSSPEELPQDLWSSILDSVSSSRSIPSKQVILLGEPSSGKSTIAAALLQKQRIEEKDEQLDFAVGYDWADIHDETDEGTVKYAHIHSPWAKPSPPEYLSLAGL